MPHYAFIDPESSVELLWQLGVSLERQYYIVACALLADVVSELSVAPYVGLSGFAAGTAYTYVRKLSKQGERGPVIVFAFSAFSILFTAPYLLFAYHPMTWQQLIFLLLSGVGGAGGQFSITAAYAHEPAKEISVFDYSQVLFAALWGFLAWGEIPDYLSVIGYVIIIGVAVFRWWYNLKEDAPAEVHGAVNG